MTRRWRLFPKYALLIIALVTGMLLASGAIGIWFSYRENQDHLVALQEEKAQGEAWLFPAATADAMSKLDPREPFVVEFLFGDGSAARATFEAGDFAAGRAFIAMGSL